MPRIFTIAGNGGFADMLAAGLMADGLAAIMGEKAGLSPGADDPAFLSKLTILLPNRRAARALAESFLLYSGGRPMLLPAMVPIGDIDEEEFDFTGGAGLAGGIDGELAPALPELRRRLLLARLIRDWEIKQGLLPRRPDQAARLAAELARLIDQVETEGVDFSALENLVPEEYASHWQISLDFFRIITANWAGVLAAEGCLDPADRRNRLIEAQAASWRQKPPPGPVIAAGSTGSIPATAELLGVVASLPQGAVILPGLDRHMDDESWAVLASKSESAATHPQYGLARLLARLGVCRTDVRDWEDVAKVEKNSKNPSTQPRLQLLSQLMRPAETSMAWAGSPPPADEALKGLSRIECPGPREEAGVIALLLREALETPGKRAALITPDRGLARRVAAEMKRWGVDMDDSAGSALSLTPPGIFLRLTAEMAAAACEPVPLLAVLKHPLACGGESAGAFRGRVRRLEEAVLRGVRPREGFDGLLAALEGDEKQKDLSKWLQQLAVMAAPFMEVFSRREVPLETLLRAHLDFAEALAGDGDEPGVARLWRGEAGLVAADFIAELFDAADGFAPLDPAHYPAFLDALMAGRPVRPRYGRNNRLFIWGLMEARMQKVDLAILGGLNEESWPARIQADPWMSRPMRARFGLSSSERRVGLSAHDFIQAFAAQEVVMTRATRVEGTPTVPSRWLSRLDALLGDGATRLGGDKYLAWHESLDRPGKTIVIAPPRPAPPLAARPRQFSVTRVETWVRDPYAIYARHILKLRPLDPLDADPGAAERGNFIHLALEHFVAAHPKDLPGDAIEKLLECGRQALGTSLERPAVRAFWWPRFERIAIWFVEQERGRRAEGISPLATEADGALILAGPGGDFTLTARADRIDSTAEGGGIIVDYKTGAPPTLKQVESGFSPQLPLEAAILAAGGFKGLEKMPVARLDYVKLSGGEPVGELKPLKADALALGEAAVAGLVARIAKFDDPTTPYLSRPHPQFMKYAGDYDHLARVKEWSSGGEADE
ncbi:MAG: double-strand break repair protein AddB [Rhodospirillaceae bacterium]|nr:double-strand break repair protein AddB [Rhodospirillaceae bacterium]